jgi:tRNA dimethylallyltransferase
MRKTDLVQRAVAILGPTASGKSALAMAVATANDGEIVACDALMVYRGLDVGTNKPTAAERTRVPHHLVDVCDPTDDMEAGRYGELALAAVADINARGKLAVIVVGTYLYYRALVHGLGPLPKGSPALRAELTEKERADPGYLAREVARIDPESFKEANGKNLPRLIRALEVFLLSGQSASALRAAHGFASRRLQTKTIVLRPDRALLNARIDARVQHMFAAGWKDEVAALLARGVPLTARAMQAVGYRDIATAPDAPALVEQIATATRQYARKQASFFRQEAGAEVFAGFGEDALRDEAFTGGIARLR